MNNTSKDSNDLKNKGSDLIKHMLQKQKNWKTQAITSEVKSEEPRNTGSCMLDAKTTRNYIASGLKSLSVSGSAKRNQASFSDPCLELENSPVDSWTKCVGRGEGHM